NLTINGNGFNNAGALENALGNNTWSKAIRLGSNSAIGVTGSGDTLIINQPIGDGTPSSGFKVTKVGAGTLDFQAAMAYTGLTQVNQGTLLLDLATGNVLIGNLTIGDGLPGNATARWMFAN